jgi:hypothetical protein
MIKINDLNDFSQSIKERTSLLWRDASKTFNFGMFNASSLCLGISRGKSAFLRKILCKKSQQTQIQKRQKCSRHSNNIIQTHKH